MARSSSDSPMRIRLSDERRAQVLDALRRYHEDVFDAPISGFQAEQLLDFFVAALGPAVYNQGVRDACAAVQAKLGDLEGEVYEPDRPYRG